MAGSPSAGDTALLVSTATPRTAGKDHQERHLPKETSLFISGRAPSVYVRALVKKAGAAEPRIHTLIPGHSIQPDLLYADHFHACFADRRGRRS